MNIDRSTLDDFINESRDHLDTLEENLMVLEDSLENPDQEIVNKLFRAAHTIKGGAGFLGLTQVSKLSHSMENLLANVRDGEAKPSMEYIDILLDSLDTLRAMIDNAEDSNDTDITELVNNIDSILEQGQQTTQEENKNKKYLAENGESWEYKPAEVKSVPEKYKYYFLLKLDLIKLEKEKDLKPYHVISLINKNSYIISGELDTSGLTLDTIEKSSNLYYKLFIVSEKDRNQLEAIIPENTVDEILAVELVDSSQVPDGISVEPAVIKREEKNEKAKESKARTLAKKSATASSSTPVKTTGSQTLKLKLDLVEKLMSVTGELVLSRNRILLLAGKYEDQELNSTIQHFDSITSELQETVMMTRMQPVGTVFNKFPRVVRDLAKKLGKEIDLVIKGAESELDKTLVDSLSDPMTHLIRNSCDHGVETPENRKEKGKSPKGTITLDAFHESGQINIVIEDDGGGIDADKIAQKAVEKGLKSEEDIASMNEKQKLSLIMLPGFSTAEQVSDVSGRGVGMDVVKSTIEKLGGSFELESKKDEGTRITLRMPLTLAIVPSFIIESSKKKFAIPQISIEEIVTIENPDEIEFGVEWEMYRLREDLLPIIRLKEILDDPTPFNEEKRRNLIQHHQDYKEEIKEKIVLVVKTGKSKYGLMVDNVIGTEEIVVKPLHSVLKKYICYSGATIMGDGGIALILNTDGIGRFAGISFYSEEDHKQLVQNQDKTDKRQVFMFKTNNQEQYAIDLEEIKRIEIIDTKKIDQIGSEEFISIDDKPHIVLHMNNYLNVENQLLKDEMFLILLKNAPKNSGLLISEIIDTVQVDKDIDTEAYTNEFVSGTATINNKMTLFLNTKAIYNSLG